MKDGNVEHETVIWLGDYDLSKHREFSVEVPPTADVYVSPPTGEFFVVETSTKLPNLCYADKRGIRCSYNLTKNDLRELVFRIDEIKKALDLLFQDKDLARQFNTYIDRIIVTPPGSLGDAAMKVRFHSNTCDIFVDENTLVGEDPEKVASYFAHEFAHCKEHVVRRYKKLPPAKGRWVKTPEGLVPEGHEVRASKFEHRTLKRIATAFRPEKDLFPLNL